MGQTRKVVLIIAATAIMAVLTSIFAYFFDYLTTDTPDTPRSVSKFLVAIKVIESRILMYGLFNYFYYD